MQGCCAACNCRNSDRPRFLSAIAELQAGNREKIAGQGKNNLFVFYSILLFYYNFSLGFVIYFYFKPALGSCDNFLHLS